MTFDELSEFRKDLKTLLKKYRTLHDDIAVVKRVLEISPDERPPFSFRIDNLDLETCTIKVKKFACKALKGRGANTCLRLIYAYFKNEKKMFSLNYITRMIKEMKTSKESLIILNRHHCLPTSLQKKKFLFGS